jgi:hypothetical protein
VQGVHADADELATSTRMPDGSVVLERWRRPRSSEPAIRITLPGPHRDLEASGSDDLDEIRLPGIRWHAGRVVVHDRGAG